MKLKSYRSPKTDVKKSSIHGKGLFAKELINKGEVIGIKSGHIIDGKTLIEKKRIIDGAELQIHDDFYIAPLTRSEREDTLIWLNHSCNPNVGPNSDIVWTAMRDINPNEEITVDYAMEFDNDSQMNCKCRFSNCRKIITGYDWKRKDLQDRYKNYFVPYLLRKMGKL